MTASSSELHYFLYRDSNCTNEDIFKEIIEEIKNFVFEREGIVLTSQGYSGVPLHGKSKLSTNEMDLWKIIDVLFKLSEKFTNLVFSISTESENSNPFFQECDKNEVLPKWVQNAAEFNLSVFGMSGVLHCVSPEMRSKNPRLSAVEIVRNFGKETRNILLTEAVKQKVRIGQDRKFGMQRMSVNLPGNLAYIARQRPDLLSKAITEFVTSMPDEELEFKLENMEKVMVYVELNARDYKIVTAVADIDAPCDIVSHRLGASLLAFDWKYSACQNGELLSGDELYTDLSDPFERERMCSLSTALLGRPLSIAHQYHMALETMTDEHKQLCRNVFNESYECSTDNRDSACSGDDEDHTKEVRINKQKKLHKRKRNGEDGKKRTLAAVLPLKLLAPAPPTDFDYELPTSTSSGQLRNFERAVNGDDVFYKESSDDKSLGEEEELEFFASRCKITDKTPTLGCNGLNNVSLTLRGTLNNDESDDGFDVSELLNAAPPLAMKDDFDDI